MPNNACNCSQVYDPTKASAPFFSPRSASKVSSSNTKASFGRSEATALPKTAPLKFGNAAEAQRPKTLFRSSPSDLEPFLAPLLSLTLVPCPPYATNCTSHFLTPPHYGCTYAATQALRGTTQAELATKLCECTHLARHCWLGGLSFEKGGSALSQESDWRLP